MRAKKKKWTRPYLNEHLDIVSLDDTFNYLVKKEATNVLEIGTGKGSFIVDMAKRYPHMTFYGFELNEDVLALCLKKVISEDLKNVYLQNGDIEVVMPSIQNELFDYIFISHPDPWPKKRHAKRRLIFPSFLLGYYRILKEGGRLYFKTDSDSLFEYAKEVLSEEKQFTIESIIDDYDNQQEFDTLTEYEQRFRSEGVKIKRITLLKEKKQ